MMERPLSGQGNLRPPLWMIVGIPVVAAMTATCPTPGTGQQPANARQASKTTAALLADLGKFDSADRDVAAAALRRVLAPFERAYPTDPRQAPDLALQQMFSRDDIRSRLLAHADEGLSYSNQRYQDDQRSACLRGARIYQALGQPADLDRFTKLVNEEILGILRKAPTEVELGVEPGSLPHAVMAAAWAMVERGGDPLKTSGELGAMIFLKAVNERHGYRPPGWEARLAWSLVHQQYSPVVIEYVLNHYPVPIPLPLQLDRESVSNPTVMIGFHIKNEANSEGPQSRKQIASLNLAARTKSIYFQPVIRQVLRETQNDAVRGAAWRALQACSRSKKVLAPEVARESELDLARVDELLTRVERSEGTPADFAKLQELIGLDYGADRDRWLNWWKQDQYGRQIAGEQGRPYVIHGRVTDASGRPIAGATVSASPATCFSKFTYGGPVSGWIDTDLQGRFKIHFGKHEDTREEFGVVPAVFRSGQDGFTMTSFSTIPGRYLSEDEIVGDSILRIDESEILRPGAPLEIDFVMQPGVVLSAAVEDELGTPIDAKRIFIRWQDVGPPEPGPVCYCKCGEQFSACHFLLPWNDPPGQQRYTSFDRHHDGRFHLPALWAGVPRQFAVELTRQSTEPEVVSEFVTFDQPGRYRLRLIVNKAAGTVRVVAERDAES